VVSSRTQQGKFKVSSRAGKGKHRATILKVYVKVGSKAREQHKHVEDRSRAKLWTVKGKV
jgi:hypothetical protein